jgi:hypothetical protein
MSQGASINAVESAGSLVDYLKGLGCVKAAILTGPKGDFISGSKSNGERVTLPVGKKSQGGDINAMRVLITEDGQAIATMNNYEVVQEVAFA